MNTIKRVMLNQLEISKIMELYEIKRQKKRLARNEMLDVCMEVIENAIRYIVSTETVPDNGYSEKKRITLIQDLHNLQEMLKKMKRTVLTIIFMLFEPELLSNLYEFGDIYIN